MVDVAQGEALCDQFLASNCLATIGPFVSKKVRSRLQAIQQLAVKSSKQTKEDEIATLKQPKTINSEFTMRDYQLKGISWLVDRYDHGISSILADEMGLGKTLQTIAFITYLKDVRKVPGPHLVVVPLRYSHNHDQHPTTTTTTMTMTTITIATTTATAQCTFILAPVLLSSMSSFCLFGPTLLIVNPPSPPPPLRNQRAVQLDVRMQEILSVPPPHAAPHQRPL